MNLGLLASGGLGFSILLKLHREYSLCSVLTDKNSKIIIDYCIDNKIPYFIGNPRGNKSKEFIDNYSIDVLLSVNYLFIVEEDLIQWPKKHAINFHGSLLPKYRGRTPHVWAIINNEQVTGVTAHLINKECDKGDIVEQIEVPIDIDDTGADILKKFEEIYPRLIDSILQKIDDDILTYFAQPKEKGCYFGKRTPDDGQIDWNWQKEQIRNWVRAQSKPYPGAFTYSGGTKIIIHKVSYCDYYYNQNQNNGEIICISPIRVKTPNGLLQVDDYECDKDFVIKKGDIWR